jgi:4-hydroxy-tetrahydrodipicolinate reductase
MTTTQPRIALIGYGKMGRELHQLAMEKDLTVSVIIDPFLDKYRFPLTAEVLREADVCIDCTTPDAVPENVRALAALKKDIVVGTTGWLSHLDEIRADVSANGTGLLYASNFSIGMHLFVRLVAQASLLLQSHPSYDVAVNETHHARKKDAPSGTALTIAKTILENFSKKMSIHTGAPEGALRNDQLHVSSQRLGSTPGIHTVTFDSAFDTIELKHTARSRQGFAEGALIAAKWIHGKKGLFTLEDMLNEIESI